MIIIGDEEDEIQWLEDKLLEEFEMKNLGGLKYFLGIKVLRCKEGVSLKENMYLICLQRLEC
jgi:hypothetical protein